MPKGAAVAGTPRRLSARIMPRRIRDRVDIVEMRQWLERERAVGAMDKIAVSEIERMIDDLETA